MREHDHLVEPLFAAIEPGAREGAERPATRRAVRARRIAALLVGLLAVAGLGWLVL